MHRLPKISQYVIDTANDAFIVIDKEGIIVMWSKKAEKMFGWGQEEAVGSLLADLIIPERLRDHHNTGMAQAAKTGQGKILHRPIQIFALHKKGHEIPIELSVNSIYIEEEIFFSASVRDNREQILYEHSLKQQVALLNLTRDSIFVLDNKNSIMFWNRGAEILYGYKGEEVINKYVSDILKTVYPIPLKEIHNIMLNKKYWEGELIHKKKDGTSITVLSRWALEVNDHNEPTRVLVTNTDISESKSYQKKIHYLATHDTLTGLANRALLEDRLQHAINQARKNNSSLATLFIDLNRFKNINDSLGHDKGDLLLKEIATRLTCILSKGDTVARLGGDEFVIILENVEKAEDVCGIAERILKNIEMSFMLDTQEVNVSASIGISMYPRDGEDYTSLMKLADVAMYQAKELGSAAFRFYSPEMNAKIFDRLLIESALYGALSRKEFLVYYQPRINSHTNRIMGVEALVRWQSPDKGLISPADFIPMAEEIGLVGMIGEWVLFQACIQNKAWQKAGLSPIKVSVNLSAQQLSNPNIVNTISKALTTSGLSAQYLELEITESGLMKNIDLVKETLIQIKELGVAISIDDFGTGYSSLAYLKRLPIDTLKIDRSFINDLGQNHDDEAIVTATIAMAHSMNMLVVAEGVTSTMQVDFLLARQCDEMQGYLFSQPFPADIISTMIEKEKWF